MVCCLVPERELKAGPGIKVCPPSTSKIGEATEGRAGKTTALRVPVSPGVSPKEPNCRRCPCGQRTWGPGPGDPGASLFATTNLSLASPGRSRDSGEEVGQPRCEMLGGLGSLLPGLALGLSVPFLYRHQGQPRVMSPNFHGLQQGCLSWQ